MLVSAGRSMASIPWDSFMIVLEGLVAEDAVLILPGVLATCRAVAGA